MREQADKHGVNKVVTLGASLMLFSGVLFVILDIIIQQIYISLNWGFCIATAILLFIHKRKLVKHTNWYTFILFMGWICYNVWVKEDHDFIKIYFIIIFGGPHILFIGNRYKWALGLFILVTYVLLYNARFGVPLSGFDFAEFYEFLHILVCGAIVYFMIGYFKHQVEFYLQKQEEIIEETISLNKSLEESNEELLVAKTALEEKNKDLETFSYVAAHDLKSPLNTIIAFQGLFKERLVEKGEYEELSEFVDYPLESANSLRDMLEKLLEFTRASNRKDIIKTEFNFSNVAEKLRLEQLNDWGPDKVEIHLDVPPTMIYSDREIVRFILQNLINNGLKYNQSPKPTIWVKTKTEEDFFRIEIKDNGIGMKAEAFANIFEPFHRLVGKADYKGTGLGLAIVSRLLHHLKGEISVESVLGEGSTFTVRLPMDVIKDVEMASSLNADIL